MRVSVVIPLYNQAPYIRRTLDSVLAQTHADFEAVVVDDGSTDGSADVVRRYQDPRVRLLVQQNAGVSTARNRGVEETAAEWVAFLDADDEWQPTFLERVVALASANESLVAVFTNRRDSATGAAHLTHARDAGDVVDDYFRFCLANRRSGMCSSAVLVRRSALLSAGGFPVGVTYGEDLDTWGRLAWVGDVGYVPDVLAVYHTETPSSAMGQEARIKAQYPAFVHTYKDWRKERRIPTRLLNSSDQFANWLLLVYASFLIEAGDKMGARDMLRREYSLMAWPRSGFVRIYLRFLVLPRLVDCWWQVVRLMLARWRKYGTRCASHISRHSYH